MRWWHVGVVANVLIAITYAGIAVPLLRSARAARRGNRLRLGAAAVFLTGAAHHVVLGTHQIVTVSGAEAEVGLALRAAFDDWHLSVLATVVAFAGAWCFWLQARHPWPREADASDGPGLDRERQALDIHDNVVQGLATAKLAFELGDNQRGMDALDKTLVGARSIITALLSAEGPLDPSDLRRERAAGEPQ
jgi:signal transduction histidine kinase